MDSLGLLVKLPMALKMDNVGTFDIADLWSVGGRMHHVDVRTYFLHKLKDRWLLVIRHIAGDDKMTMKLTSSQRMWHQLCSIDTYSCTWV